MPTINSPNPVSGDSSLIAPAFLLQPGEARDQTFEIHPIVTDKAKIPTPAVKDAFEIIKTAIVHRDPGVCFIADSRFGKTFGIDVLRQTLPQCFPKLPVFSVIAKDHDRPTERTLYTDILLDCRHGVTDTGTAIARRMRLLNMWVATMQASGEDRLVMFVDEAQNWTVEDYTRIRDLSNDLASHGIRLITVLFGNPGLITLRASLIGEKRADLIGRFMLHPFYFRGVSSILEMVEVMKCYDSHEISEFPVGSNICYSQFFRPDAYQSGWRLEQEAGKCWAAFSSSAGKHGGNYQVGMQWVASAIRNFLYVYWQAEHGQPYDAGDVWSEAVSASGFEFTLGVTQDPKLASP